jgi:hypothetical protein
LRTDIACFTRWPSGTLRTNVACFTLRSYGSLRTNIPRVAFGTLFACRTCISLGSGSSIATASRRAGRPNRPGRPGRPRLRLLLFRVGGILFPPLPGGLPGGGRNGLVQSCRGESPQSGSSEQPKSVTTMCRRRYAWVRETHVARWRDLVRARSQLPVHAQPSPPPGSIGKRQRMEIGTCHGTARTHQFSCRKTRCAIL